MLGIDAFLEILAKAGVRHIFGNPGSTLKPPTAEPYAALCYEGSEAPVAPCFIRSFRIGSSLGSVKRSKVDTF